MQEKSEKGLIKAPTVEKTLPFAPTTGGNQLCSLFLCGSRHLFSKKS